MRSTPRGGIDAPDTMTGSVQHSNNTDNFSTSKSRSNQPIYIVNRHNVHAYFTLHNFGQQTGLLVTGFRPARSYMTVWVV